MTREGEIREKARELAIEYCKYIDHHGKELYNVGCAIACCEMADWADQHPRKVLWDAEKVCSFIEENIDNYLYVNRDWNAPQIKSNFIEDLRKARED